MLGTVAVITAILLAAGVILVLGYLWISTLKEKVKERNSDYFKIIIKEKEKIAGVPVITVDVYNKNLDKIDEQKYASLEGTSISKGDYYYNN